MPRRSNMMNKYYLSLTQVSRFSYFVRNTKMLRHLIFMSFSFPKVGSIAATARVLIDK